MKLLWNRSNYILLLLLSIALMQGCTAVATFPTVARGGDTISVMVGGSEKARKQTTNVVLTDANGIDWDLQALGLVRSVFNLRLDGRAEGLHYSGFLESYFPWFYGHEPVQTVLVTDLPSGIAVGNATLTVNTNVDDDSSGIFPPFSIQVEIVPGSGSADSFLRQDGFAGQLPADFERLEPAAHAKISFSAGSGPGTVIAAASLLVDYDETVVTPGDINVYVPEATFRGSASTTGQFGEHQRMVYWREDSGQIRIDMVAPQGINSNYLKIYLMNPRNLSGSPGFTLISADIYDVNGNNLMLQPVLEYNP